MAKRRHASFGAVFLWMGIVSVALAFTPIAVALYFHTSGFSDCTLESVLSFIVPALMALAALALGIVGPTRKKQSRRLAIVGTALSLIALVGCALTINGFQKVSWK